MAGVGGGSRCGKTPQTPKADRMCRGPIDPGARKAGGAGVSAKEGIWRVCAGATFDRCPKPVRSARCCRRSLRAPAGCVPTRRFPGWGPEEVGGLGGGLVGLDSWSAANKRSTSTGLVKYSDAPRRPASIAVPMLPKPVRTMRRARGWASLRRGIGRPRPDEVASRRLMTAPENTSDRQSSRAASGTWWSLTRRPRARRPRASRSRKTGSSSTSRRAFGSLIR